MSDEGAAFQLKGELGRGGMGVVYRAFDERLGRAVALKIGLVAEAGARLDRFRREGEIAASLEHPGIVRVHSAGSISGRPFLCFELVEGCVTLEVRLLAAPLEERLRLLVETAEALGYAHAQGVVHRDIKPENILIDAEGRARLADFGVALALDRDRLTGTGTALGTPFYAAPEQLRDGHRVGPPADVWSLGVILYQALTGELPFNGDSLLSLVAQIASGTFDPPRRLAPTTSPGLEAVCLSALRVDPAERYPSAIEFAADLARAQRGERTEVESARDVGSRQGLALVVSLLVLAAVATTIFALSRKDEAASTASPTPSARRSPETWRPAAERALAEAKPAQALELLAAAPLDDSRANALRAEGWLRLGKGARALVPIQRLEPGTPRATWALRALVEGASSESARPLLAEVPLGEKDPSFVRWRFLELCARPGSLKEIERAYRGARRGNPDAEELRAFADFHRVLAGFSWEPDAIWALGEDSQQDPRLAEAAHFVAKLGQASAGEKRERRALFLGIQRWALPRLRFTLSRLHERKWRALAGPVADLLESPEADEIRLLVLAGRTNGMDDIVPARMPPRELAMLALSRARRAALPAEGYRLLLAAQLARGTELRSPYPARRRLTAEVMKSLPSPEEVKLLGLPGKQAVEVAKEACLIEVLRCTEEAWLAESRAERIAALEETRLRLAAVQEKFAQKWLNNDWRYLVARLRLAALSDDREALREVALAPWTDTRRRALRASFLLESHLLSGDLVAARVVAKNIEEEGSISWMGLIGNQLLFLEDPPQRGAAQTLTRPSDPFPWRREAETKRLLAAGWRPGQPLLPALGRD